MSFQFSADCLSSTLTERTEAKEKIKTCRTRLIRFFRDVDYVRQDPMLDNNKDKHEFAKRVMKMHLKKISVLLIVICASMLLTSCADRYSSEEFWGSFTADKTYSYDRELYAIQ